MSAHGIRPTTDQPTYGVLSDSGLYEESISGFVPSKEVLGLGDDEVVQRKLGDLIPWGKVFIRSELGSAAKFAGIEACIIDSFEENNIRRKVDILRSAFPAAEKLIARRVEEVKKVGSESAEGRFIIVCGKLAYMDHCEIADEAERDAFDARNRPNAEQVVADFRAAGIGGDYFLDIAEKADGGWFVVEVKPAFNGTVRQPAKLAGVLSGL